MRRTSVVLLDRLHFVGFGIGVRRVAEDFRGPKVGGLAWTAPNLGRR